MSFAMTDKPILKHLRFFLVLTNITNTTNTTVVSHMLTWSAMKKILGVHCINVCGVLN